MEQKKAVVKFIDALDRAVLLTEDNETIVLYPPINGQVRVGFEVEIMRAKGHRRMSDWCLVTS